MKTVKQACIPRASTFDPTRRDTVLDLTDLIGHRIGPAEFFAENHITEGMKTLLTEGFRRLEGKSTPSDASRRHTCLKLSSHIDMETGGGSWGKTTRSRLR